MKNNKFDREQAHKKKILQRAKKLKWGSKLENIPKETIIALSTTGDIRISSRDKNGLCKKQFGKSSRKRYYGHFSGVCKKHLNHKELKERIFERE